MSPNDAITRAEFEERMNALRAEIHQSQVAQDEAWNLGFRAIRSDVQSGIQSIRDDVRDRAASMEQLFNARLSPVRTVAYGMVGMGAAMILAELLGSGKIKL